MTLDPTDELGPRRRRPAPPPPSALVQMYDPHKAFHLDEAALVDLGQALRLLRGQMSSRGELMSEPLLRLSARLNTLPNAMGPDGTATEPDGRMGLKNRIQVRPDDYVGVKDAMALLGKRNKKTIQRWLESGKLRGHKVGGCWWILRSSVLDHLPRADA